MVEKFTKHIFSVMIQPLSLVYGLASLPGYAQQVMAPLPPSSPIGTGTGTSITPNTQVILNSQQILKNVVGLFPKRVVLLETMEDKEIPEFFKMPSTPIQNLGYFEIANSPVLDWEAKINYQKFSSMDILNATFLISNADTIVHMPKSGAWTVYRRSSSVAKAKVASRPGPSQSDISTVVQWLFETLNWDGVVLGQEGDTLIVGSSEKLLKGTQLQALAVENSHSKFILSASERKGSGLLSLEKSAGGIGYFNIVFLGAGLKTLPIGTKVIIEKKK